MENAVNSFTIWIDADSCPVQVRDLTLRFATRLQIPLHYVANRIIPHHETPLISMTVCEANPNAADDYIVEHILPNDLAITRDIPLASRLVDKKICVLNDRGVVFTEKNIAEKLASRNLNYMLLENGLLPAEKKGNTYGKKEINAFANSLDRELQKKLRALKIGN